MGWIPLILLNSILGIFQVSEVPGPFPHPVGDTEMIKMWSLLSRSLPLRSRCCTGINLKQGRLCYIHVISEIEAKIVETQGGKTLTLVPSAFCCNRGKDGICVVDIALLL